MERFLKNVNEIVETHRAEFQNVEIKILFFGYRVKRSAREMIKSQGAYMIFTHGKEL